MKARNLESIRLRNDAKEPRLASAQSKPAAGRAQLLLLAVVTLLALWPLCGGEFTSWDDAAIVSNNPTLNPPTLHSLKVWWTTARLDLWDPVTDMLRGALALVGTTASPDPVTGTRLNPYVYHTANLLLHIATVLVVFQVLRLLLAGVSETRQTRWAACAGALLFAVHPLQVESVGWVTAMKDLLCGLLCLTALWRYLIYASGGEIPNPNLPATALRAGQIPVRPGSPLANKFQNPNSKSQTSSDFWLATFLFVLATLSKPTAVVLPAIVLVLNWWVLRRPLRQVWRGMLLWAVLALPCIIVTKLVQPAVNTVTIAWWRRPLVAADALAFYLYKLIWPASLGLDYGRRPDWIFQHGMAWWTWLVPAALAVLLWIFRRRAPLLVAAAMIFVLGLLPVLGFVRFDFQQYSTVSDHYLYLSMFGVAMAVGWMLYILPRPAIYVASVVLCALAARAWVQTWVWQSNETLYRHAVAVNPLNGGLHGNLAIALEIAGRHDEANLHYQQARVLNATNSKALLSLGQTMRRRGNTPQAKQFFRAAAQADPKSALAHSEVAKALFDEERWEESIAQYRAALALEPNNVAVQTDFGVALARNGQWNDSFAVFSHAVAEHPDNAEAHAGLARVLVQLGRPREAMDQYQAALKIDPDLPLAKSGYDRLRRSPGGS